MTTVALGEVVDFYSGGTPSRARAESWHGDVPWFSAKDMKQPRLADSTSHISETVFRSTSLRKLPAGTVVMVVRGMILAHTVPVAILDVDSAINQDLKALLPRREIEPSFLAAMLRAQHGTILGQVSTAAHGTKKLESRVLENIRIPLPSPHEQRRIAAILDHADALRAKRRQVLTHVESLAQSIFHDMFGHVPASLPLRSVVEEFRYGTSNKSGDVGNPTLRIPNVIGGSLNLHEIKTVTVEDAELERLRLRRGDLLFVRSNGNPESVGRCAVFDPVKTETLGYAPDSWIYASYLIRGRLADEHEPDFIATFMTSRAGRRQLLKRSKTSAGQYNINIDGLGSVEVPVVPTARQREYVGLLEATRRQISAVNRGIAADDELFGSLQARAFKGEL